MSAEHAHRPSEQGDALPLYASVERAIADALGDGRLEGGDVLTESVVSHVLKVSRTPVRSAFERLVEQGLLEKGSGRGYIVPGPPPSGKRRRLGRGELTSLIAGHAERSPAAWIAIYNEVEREICARSVFGRSRIVEVELANAYGVSRTVAHEVLARLERLGLIEKGERGRWFVVPLTVERVRQIYEVRSYLEPPALRAATGRIPQSDLQEMWQRLEQAQRRYPEVSITELDVLERDIHVDCIGHCGNDELIKLLRINQALLISNKHMLGSYLQLPELDPFIAEHAAVLDSLLQRDGDAASRALGAHLAASVVKVLHRMEVLGRANPPPAPSYLSAA